jgi:16S rRNA (guanine527-N7)-methyltransferase
MVSKVVTSYFPDISEKQKAQFDQLGELYSHWNHQINVISRKDIDELNIRHVLHSLGIAKVLAFKPGSRVLDVGTGGGFPGIPLAILFPETHFVLVDSIGKKIKVVNEVAQALELKNVEAHHMRAENTEGTFDFVVSRAVTAMPKFVTWVKNKFAKESVHKLENGILYLKGGDLSEELSSFSRCRIYPLPDFFSEDFFETKAVVHLPKSGIRK